MLVIKLLGLGKQIDKLLKCMDDVHLDGSAPIMLEIIKEATRILQHDIGGIPAIIVGDRALGEGCIPAVSEIANSIQEYYQPGRSMSDRMTKSYPQGSF